MKKVFALLLTVSLILSYAIAFTACSTKTKLTKDNYEQYIKISIEPDLSDKRTNITTGDYGYKKIGCTVEITPAASYIKFSDCTVSIIVKLSYTEIQDNSGNPSYVIKYSEQKVFCNLDIGGNGSGTSIFTLPGSSLARDTRIASFDIDSISGRVTVD